MAETISRFFDCCIIECDNASALEAGACERCRQHYCWRHVNHPASHPCSKEPLDDAKWIQARDAEVASVLRKLDKNALLRKASQLRGDIECHVLEAPNGQIMLGGMNLHVEIRFADGVAWLARIPRQNFTSFSDHLTNAIIASECATMKWLEAVDIPSPKMYAYGLLNDPSNEVGVPYMLIDKLPGKPFLQLDPSSDDKQKVFDGIAHVLSKIAKHPLSKIGCLHFAAHGEVEVQNIVCDRTGTLLSCGPFDDAREYYATWCEQYLRLISDHQLFHEFPVEAYCIFSFMKEEAMSGHWNFVDRADDLDHFYLKHMDDKGDHILVDDQFNLTGLIDWSFARAVPAYEAFGPSLLSADLNDLWSGVPGRSNDDSTLAESVKRRSPALTRYADVPDVIRRMTLGLGIGLGMSREEAIALFTCAFLTSNPDVKDFDFDLWQRAYLKRRGNDERLQSLTSESMQIGEHLE